MHAVALAARLVHVVPQKESRVRADQLLITPAKGYYSKEPERRKLSYIIVPLAPAALEVCNQLQDRRLLTEQLLVHISTQSCRDEARHSRAPTNLAWLRMLQQAWLGPSSGHKEHNQFAKSPCLADTGSTYISTQTHPPATHVQAPPWPTEP